MSEKNRFEGVQKVVRVTTAGVSSSISCKCRDCDDYFHDFELLVNHYLNSHRYKLLHVGTETDEDGAGKPFDATVAVLGT